MTSEYDRRPFFCAARYLSWQAYLSMFFFVSCSLAAAGDPLALSGWLMSIFSVGSMLMRPAGSILNESSGEKSLPTHRFFFFAALCLFSFPIL